MSSFYKRYNYDQAIDEAKKALNDGEISVAKAQFLIWNIKTNKNELNGTKVKVGNLKKLTEDESLAVQLLISEVYTKETNTESLYGRVLINRTDKSVLELNMVNQKDHNRVFLLGL